MHLTLVGLSHHTAPIDVRDQAILPETLPGKVLSFMQSSAGIIEAVLLSTCNRSEMYATTDEEHTDPKPIARTTRLSAICFGLSPVWILLSLVSSRFSAKSEKPTLIL